MKLKGILILFLLSVSITGFSQRWKLKRYEVLFGFGSTNVYGDIGGTADAKSLYGLKDIKINETRFSLSGGVRYKIKRDMALKLNLIYGQGVSDDKGSRNDDRGYSFKTTIFEPSVQYEYAFLSEDRKVDISKLYNRRGMVNNFTVFSAYAFAGLGGAFFSPKVNLNGNSAVPGETITGYNKTAIVIPVGLGVKYGIDKNWSLCFEFGRRIVFSDYVDGISTKWSKGNDAYYFGLFQASYKLVTDRRGIPSFLVRKARSGRARL
jgi:opacity protein-like surface antigen